MAQGQRMHRDQVGQDGWHRPCNAGSNAIRPVRSSNGNPSTTVHRHRDPYGTALLPGKLKDIQSGK